MASIYGVVCDAYVDEKVAVRMHSGSNKYLWVIVTHLLTLIATTAVYTAPFRIQRVIRCLSKVQKIKKGLTHELNEDYKWLERLKFSTALLFLAFGVTLFLCNYWISYLQPALEKGTNPLIVSLFAIYQKDYLMILVLELQFYIISLETYEAFKMSNDVLENASHRHAEPRYKMTEAGKDTIHHLAAAHSSLCAVTKTLVEAFEALLILLLMSCLLNLVVAANNFINSSFKAQPMRILIVRLALCIFHVIRTMMLTEPPHLTQLEMDRTRSLVNELVLRSSDISTELDRFYRHLQLGSATYAPMGICTLSRPLFASMLGTVVTYVVIVTQLQGRN